MISRDKIDSCNEVQLVRTDQEVDRDSGGESGQQFKSGDISSQCPCSARVPCLDPLRSIRESVSPFVCQFIGPFTGPSRVLVFSSLFVTFPRYEDRLSL